MAMSFKVKYILLFVWLSSLYIVPLLIFAKGLLLHRDVLPHRSLCRNDSFSVCLAATVNLSSCLHLYDSTNDGQYCVPSETKIILLVVDALRFDFVEHQTAERDPAPYHNKLKSITGLLTTRSEHARLFRFIADPPTTTMQRIKGLTTGSLPTFIDIGSNFASTEIDEDNIIDNMIRKNKNIVFLGDDTWTKLYPTRFIRSFPFDSFNVWDLDTVDRGIEKHLLSEIRKTDWHLIVAHFLGVDHCGHRYGPNHVEMERKLMEMDFIIKDVLNEIETRDDVILFVIGDHGMTATGDHGGGTENEVTTALFAYSPVYAFFNDSRRASRSVSQVDIVPTLASILGVPVPFSNTGRIVLECIPKSIVRSVKDAAFILWQTIEQITKYMKKYSAQNAQFESARMDQILSKFSQMENRWFRIESVKVFREFVAEYDSYMKSILAMCQQVWIQFDFFLIYYGISFMAIAAVLTIIAVSKTKAEIPTDLDVTYSVSAFFISWLLLPLYTALILFQFISVMCLGRWCLKQVRIPWKPKIDHVLFLLTHVCSAVALFSNSFILEEPSVVLFFIATCLWFSCVRSWHKFALSDFIVAGVAYRSGFYAVRCREDQTVCNKSLSGNNYNKKFPFVATLVFFSLISFHKDTSRFLTFVSKTCMALLTLFWIKESILGDALSHYSFVDSIPGLVFAVCLVSLVVLVRDPVLDTRVVDDRVRARLACSNVTLIVCIFNAVLLDTSVSVFSVSAIVCLQHGGAFLSSVCDSNGEITWSSLVLWSMSAGYWFYATGHYASFSAIQWSAAFLFQKDIGSSMLLPGTFVTMNTFASYIVHSLLLLILLTYNRRLPSSKKAYFHRSTIAYLKYVTIMATRLLAMMMACALHSRHLMMWRIFAPKFIFEAVAFLITIVSSVLGLIITFNINK